MLRQGQVRLWLVQSIRDTGFVREAYSHTPPHWVCFTRRLFNSNNFTVSVALAEVYTLLSVILVLQFLVSRSWLVPFSIKMQLCTIFIKIQQGDQSWLLCHLSNLLDREIFWRIFNQVAHHIVRLPLHALVGLSVKFGRCQTVRINGPNIFWPHGRLHPSSWIGVVDNSWESSLRYCAKFDESNAPAALGHGDQILSLFP